MIVKLKENPPFEKYKNDNIFGLDKKNKYRVISIVSPNYMLIDEVGELALYPMLFFDVIENTLDDDWSISIKDYGNDEYDIQVCIESQELKNFNYEKFYNDDIDSCNFFIRYLQRKNIVFVANLAYCPIRPLQEYYKKLLERIDQQERSYPPNPKREV